MMPTTEPPSDSAAVGDRSHQSLAAAAVDHRRAGTRERGAETKRGIAIDRIDVLTDAQ